MSTCNEGDEVDNQDIDKAERHNTLSLIAKELEQFHTVAIMKSNEWKAKVNDLVGSPKTIIIDTKSTKCIQTELDYAKIILENVKLKEESELLSKIINISYEKLKSIRKEPLDKVDMLEQIKQLIVCCGQYYADYSNERNRTKQLEQKNNFLYNKTLLLNNNVLGLKEELKNVKFQNMRLKSELGRLRNIKRPLKRNKFSLDNNLSDHSDIPLNVESHLKLIKQLLFDQDNALKELCKIGKNLIP